MGNGQQQTEQIAGQRIAKPPGQAPKLPGEVADKPTQQLLEKLFTDIRTRIENRMEINHLRDRTLAMRKWSMDHAGQPYPKEFADTANFREALIDKVYCWFIARRDGVGDTSLTNEQIAEYQSITEKLGALADRLEASAKGSGRGGLNAYLSYEAWLAKLTEEERKKKTRVDYLLDECSLTDEDIETYRKAKTTTTFEGLPFEINTAAFQRLMDRHTANGRKPPISAERFLAICKEEGVDPTLALAQAIGESSVGTAGKAVPTHNICNVGNNKTSSNPQGDWELGLRLYCRLVRDHYGASLEQCFERRFKRTDTNEYYCESGDSYAFTIRDIGNMIRQELQKAAQR